MSLITGRLTSAIRHVRSTSVLIATASLIVYASVSLLQAQQAALASRVLHGTVHDPLGSVVPGAAIELLADTRVIAKTLTGADGEFELKLQEAGRYSVRVSAQSFQTVTTPAVYSNGSAKADLEVTLAAGTLTQQVTVTTTGTALPEAQTGASVTVLAAGDFRNMREVQSPLRLVPGAQVTQVGQMGGTAGLSIRGGGTDANKVLVDGVPANAIGGRVEFANLANVGINSMEVLREPNSALYGSDALAGVVSLTTVRGTTPLPLFTYSGDAGNFHTYRNDVSAGTAYRQFDLFSEFARIDTANNLPNSAFHNATYVGNFGWTPSAANDLRFTVRQIVVSGGQPNAIALYGIPDAGQQRERDHYYSAVWNNETTPRWHNQVRYAGLLQNGTFTQFGATGIPDPNSPGFFDGASVTVKGANGYSVSGQAQFQYSSTLSQSISTTNRDFVYAQTDYRLNAHTVALGGFKYENESGASTSTGSPITAIERGNYSYTLQFSGDLRNRLFYTIGTGLENNGLFGFAATPRVSLAYYLFHPSMSGFFSGTKLHGSFGKGIKEPAIYDQANSLYGLLTGLPGGSALLTQYGVSPLGPEDSRTYDGGVDQQLFNGRARLGLTYFHNEFTHGVEYVPPAGLLQLGVPAANLPQVQQVGAYLNSMAFRAQGLELEAEYKINSRIFARGGYTYTDAMVQRSFSSDNIGPSFNASSNFSTVPIGVYSPLVGGRPFRIAPHTGYFGLNYAGSRFFATLTGTLVSRRDDSDFLCDNTIPYGCGTSLLLPNRNLDGAYQRLELGGSYQVTSRVSIYSNLQNLISQHYQEAFGYPALPLTFRSGIKFSFGGESWKLK